MLNSVAVAKRVVLLVTVVTAAGVVATAQAKQRSLVDRSFGDRGVLAIHDKRLSGFDSWDCERKRDGSFDMWAFARGRGKFHPFYVAVDAHVTAAGRVLSVSHSIAGSYDGGASTDDGRGGYYEIAYNDNVTRAFLQHFNRHGKKIKSFGTRGHVEVPSFVSGNSSLLLIRGRILYLMTDDARTRVTAFTRRGAVDTSFGTAGILAFDDRVTETIEPRRGGGLWLLGSRAGQDADARNGIPAVVTALDDHGKPDAAFGTGGTLELSAPQGNHLVAQGVRVLNGGRLRVSYTIEYDRARSYGWAWIDSRGRTIEKAGKNGRLVYAHDEGSDDGSAYVSTPYELERGDRSLIVEASSENELSDGAWYTPLGRRVATLITGVDSIGRFEIGSIGGMALDGSRRLYVCGASKGRPAILRINAKTKPVKRR